MAGTRLICSALATAMGTYTTGDTMPVNRPKRVWAICCEKPMDLSTLMTITLSKSVMSGSTLAPMVMGSARRHSSCRTARRGA